MSLFFGFPTYIVLQEFENALIIGHVFPLHLSLWGFPGSRRHTCAGSFDDEKVLLAEGLIEGMKKDTGAKKDSPPLRRVFHIGIALLGVKRGPFRSAYQMGVKDIEDCRHLVEVILVVYRIFVGYWVESVIVMSSSSSTKNNSGSQTPLLTPELTPPLTPPRIPQNQAMPALNAANLSRRLYTVKRKGSNRVNRHNEPAHHGQNNQRQENQRQDNYGQANQKRSKFMKEFWSPAALENRQKRYAKRKNVFWQVNPNTGEAEMVRLPNQSGKGRKKSMKQKTKRAHHHRRH
jgi:hypothetical protein